MAADPYAEKLSKDEAEAEQAFVDSYKDVDWWAEELMRRVVRYCKHWQLSSDPYEAMDMLATLYLIVEDEEGIKQRLYKERNTLQKETRNRDPSPNPQQQRKSSQNPRGIGLS